MRVPAGVPIAVLLLCGTPGCQARDCADIRQEARDLIAGAQTCGAGDQCVLVDLYALAGENNCLSPFQCSQPVREGYNLDDLGRRARALTDDYRQCTECAIASCVPASSMTAACNETTGRCEVVIK